MREDIVTRFAPSPTGRLHLGHGWSAIRAHDAARAAGGRFLLRIEDIDTARCRDAFVDAIFEDLRWLGLGWDGDVLFQSQRGAAYAEALGRLRALGLLYVCTCTRADIAASAPHGADAVYPGACRGLERTPDPARPHCWRIDMRKASALAGPLFWEDEMAGRVACEALAQGDVVIARKDALASYHLAVTIDDAAQHVTQVVRGCDLFDATHVHRLLQALLGLPVPIYAHHRLIVGADGERLAKRRNAPTLAGLRENGMDGQELAEMMRAGRFPTGFALESA